MTGAVPPARVARLIVQSFDSAAILFDPDHRTVHRLNHTAFAIWSACDGFTDTGEIAHRLAGSFDLDPAAILGDVEAGVGELLDGGAIGSPETEHDADANTDQWRLQDLAGLTSQNIATLVGRDWPHHIGPLVAFDCHIDVMTNHDAVAVALRSFLTPLMTLDHDNDRSAERGPDDTDHVVRVDDLGDGGGLEVTIDDHCMGRHTNGPAAVRQVIWLINRLATCNSPNRPTFHAAAAQRNGATVLLPAESNGGKSTLVAGLIQRGYDYLSDEAVGIGPDPLLVYPYPKAISLDPGSFAVLSELEPELPAGLAAYKERTWQVPPASIRDGVQCTPGELRLVVFPTYAADSPTVVEAMEPIDTLDRLLHLMFELRPDPLTAVGTLRRIADEVPAYAITSGDLAEACAAVDDLRRSTGT